MLSSYIIHPPEPDSDEEEADAANVANAPIIVGSTCVINPAAAGENPVTHNGILVTQPILVVVRETFMTELTPGSTMSRKRSEARVLTIGTKSVCSKDGKGISGPVMNSLVSCVSTDVPVPVADLKQINKTEVTECLALELRMRSIHQMLLF